MFTYDKMRFFAPQLMVFTYSGDRYTQRYRYVYASASFGGY
ncbi:hypothetical protein ACE1CI_04200 [Aerosakkonemataceae cyanobacterium BLCC-F50]|uniref:Uncharacterized protein n=1 Tax=Floridaenema flaviceps BLCC-F50 TaxID=3153642 RepID=A0ABV4XKB0_9CYAN